jgi:hypothetical protein
MLLILAPSVSNRLRYIADLMLRRLLGIEVHFTMLADEFQAYEGPKICFAHQPLADGIFIKASGLLFDTGAGQLDVNPSTIDGIPVIFGSKDPLSEFQFDLFAASFYLVSRYEEYQPHKRDGFGRYPAIESVAWRGKFLDMPVVNIWTGMLQQLLARHFPGLEFRLPAYRFVPTIDVDHAWCYKGRTLSRTIGGFTRSLIHGRLIEIADRIKVVAGVMPDPYDNYAYIDKVHDRYTHDPVYFILFADYGNHDNNVQLTRTAFHRLLKALDAAKKVGIHPSLSSNKYPSRLENEYHGLCSVLDRKVTLSRQHFLKLSMPGTYRQLLQLGITDDYSMGYASHVGFRAGIATPFPFFDVLKNEVTPLMVHPVAVMDVTLKDYLRLTKVESLGKIKDMINTVRSVNGEFVSLWHNESLGETGRWTGWREVYKEMVDLAST